MAKAPKERSKGPYHDKVLLIVEETIQHVYLLDPDDIRTGAAINVLRDRLVHGEPAEVPQLLGKRGRVGPALNPEGAEMKPDLTRGVFTKLNYVIPDEEGYPHTEIVLTKTKNDVLIERKPAK